MHFRGTKFLCRATKLNIVTQNDELEAEYIEFAATNSNHMKPRTGTSWRSIDVNGHCAPPNLAVLTGAIYT